MGYFSTIGIILIPAMAAFIGVASFMTWQTAAIYVAVVGCLLVLAVRLHEKYNRPHEYDDRLTDERMDDAREWLVGKWKDQDAED